MDQQGLYSHWQDIYSHQQSDFRAQSLARLAISLLPSQGKILDLGCGTCGLTLVLLDRGRDVDSVDTAPEMLEMGRTIVARFGHSTSAIRQATIAELASSNCTHYDAVVCLDVLEHISDDAEALSQIFQILKPGGCLLLTAYCLRFRQSPVCTAQKMLN
jgi:2-polyprenyl-3-methyl-5-hydroxy-6-metoxy-1,4-benzoquinol methylase